MGVTARALIQRDATQFLLERQVGAEVRPREPWQVPANVAQFPAYARALLAMSQEEFSAAFKGSPMKRANLRGFAAQCRGRAWHCTPIVCGAVAKAFPFAPDRHVG